MDGQAGGAEVSLRDAASSTAVGRLPADVARLPWPVRCIPSLGLAASVAACVFVFTPAYWSESVGLVLGYIFTPVGKDAWLVAGHAGLDLPLVYTVVLLWFVEAAVALFFVLVPNVERVIVRMPRIGRRIQRFEERIRAHPAAQYGVGSALAVLVALPIHSGGGILGPMVGRAAGLSWLQAYGAVMAGVTLRFTVEGFLIYGVAAVL